MLTKWDQPLQFILQPDPRGKILVISGKFTAGDADRLRTFLSTSGPISEVQFDSGGGNAAEGPKIGRVIRAAGLSTRVASGFACISSCSMAFLGGVVRKIDVDAIYGLHTFYNSQLYDTLSQRTTEDGKRNYLHQVEQNNAILAGEIQLYGQQMGISRSFFTTIMFAQRSEIFVSDQRLGQLRTILTAALSPDQAKALIYAMNREGIILLSTNEQLADANELLAWMQRPHTQIEVDTKLAEIISNDFRCISRSELNRYNITNVISQ